MYANKNRGKLLEGVTVFISKNIQAVNKETLAALVTSAGGEEMPEKNKDKATLMILDEVKDKKLIDSYKGKKNIPHICGMEFLFEGIL